MSIDPSNCTMEADTDADTAGAASTAAALPPVPSARERALVLVVEDDAAMRRMIGEVLEEVDAEVQCVGAQIALDLLEEREVAVVVTDLRMPQVDGLEILQFARQCHASTQVILLTGTPRSRRRSRRSRVAPATILRKPFEPDDLRRVVDRALAFNRLMRENIRLREASGARRRPTAWWARARPSSRCAGLSAPAPVTTAACCVTGESGTGKEVVARQIHLTQPAAREAASWR
jgi:DNA-binding NtrC family response regulator